MLKSDVEVKTFNLQSCAFPMNLLQSLSNNLAVTLVYYYTTPASVCDKFSQSSHF